MGRSLESSRPILASNVSRMSSTTESHSAEIPYRRRVSLSGNRREETGLLSRLHNSTLPKAREDIHGERRRTVSPGYPPKASFFSQTPFRPDLTSESDSDSDSDDEIQSSKRASHRFSTYSASPSIAFSEKSVNSATPSNDPRIVEIKDIEQNLERLNDKRLSEQRFVVSEEKKDNMSKLALGAKLDRALRWRMSGQDAVFRTKSSSNEKVG